MKMTETDLKFLIKEVVRECVTTVGQKSNVKEFGLTSETGGYDEAEEMRLVKGLHLITKKLMDMHKSDGESQEKALDERKKKRVDKWIQRAIDPKHKGYCTPMTKPTCTPRRKALAKRFKKGLEEIKQECEMYLAEGGPQYKVVSPNATDTAKENKPFQIQYDPQVSEASYKVVSPTQARVARCDHARTVQTDPEVTEQVGANVVAEKAPPGFGPGKEHSDIYSKVKAQYPGEPAKQYATMWSIYNKMEEARKVRESNHKVQHRSYKTINDVPQDPKNVRDPEVPQA